MRMAFGAKRHMFLNPSSTTWVFVEQLVSPNENATYTICTTANLGQIDVLCTFGGEDRYFKIRITPITDSST